MSVPFTCKFRHKIITNDYNLYTELYNNKNQISYFVFFTIFLYLSAVFPDQIRSLLIDPFLIFIHKLIRPHKDIVDVLGSIGINGSHCK